MPKYATCNATNKQMKLPQLCTELFFSLIRWRTAHFSIKEKKQSNYKVPHPTLDQNGGDEQKFKRKELLQIENQERPVPQPGQQDPSHLQRATIAVHP